MDWERQKTVQFSGLPGTWPQDSGMQETMGRVTNRSAEHLGISDTGIIRTRRALLKAAKLLRDYGIEPDSVWDPDVYHIRSASVVLPRDAEWVEASAEYRTPRENVNYARCLRAPDPLSLERPTPPGPQSQARARAARRIPRG